MSDKNKWKTYPCKECVIKGVCVHRCFDFASISYDKIIQHVIENHLELTCLSCGTKDVDTYPSIIQWDCMNCGYKYRLK